MGDSNTAGNSETRRRGPGRPFVKGDPRINRNGRPKTSDALRALILRVLHEVALEGDAPKTVKIIDAQGEIVERQVTVVESIVYEWARGDYQQKRALIEFAYGKPAQAVDVTSGGEKLAARVEVVEIIKVVRDEH